MKRLFSVIVFLVLLTLTVSAQSKDLIRSVNEGFNAIQRHYIEVAAEYYSAGDYRNAITWFNKYLANDPYQAKVYYLRGLAKCKLRRYEDALSDFSKAIKYNSSLGEAYRERGLVKEALGNSKGACSDFHKASSLGAYCDDLIDKFCR